MAEIDRIFLMGFHKAPVAIVDFLPESNGLLVGVDFLQVSGSPTYFARHVKPVKSSTVSEQMPVSESAFVLGAVCHKSRRGDRSRVSLGESYASRCLLKNVRAYSFLSSFHTSPKRKRRDGATPRPPFLTSPAQPWPGVISAMSAGNSASSEAWRSVIIQRPLSGPHVHVPQSRPSPS